MKSKAPQRKALNGQPGPGVNLEMSKKSNSYSPDFVLKTFSLSISLLKEMGSIYNTLQKNPQINPSTQENKFDLLHLCNMISSVSPDQKLINSMSPIPYNSTTLKDSLDDPHRRNFIDVSDNEFYYDLHPDRWLFQNTLGTKIPPTKQCINLQVYTKLVADELIRGIIDIQIECLRVAALILLVIEALWKLIIPMLSCAEDFRPCNFDINGYFERANNWWVDSPYKVFRDSVPELAIGNSKEFLLQVHCEGSLLSIATNLINKLSAFQRTILGMTVIHPENIPGPLTGVLIILHNAMRFDSILSSKINTIKDHLVGKSGFIYVIDKLIERYLVESRVQVPKPITKKLSLPKKQTLVWNKPSSIWKLSAIPSYLSLFNDPSKIKRTRIASRTEILGIDSSEKKTL